MKIDRVTPAGEPSLIERAALVYDFGAHLRGRVAEPEPALVPEPVLVPDLKSGCDEPSPVHVERSRDRLSSKVENSDHGTADLDFARRAPSTSLGMNGGRHAVSLESDPEQIPAEWAAAPSDIAAIDRIMLAEKGMLVPGAPIGALAEEFRLVKRQLLITARAVSEGPMGNRARTILVGSGKPGDGKTYCAINLALSLAAERDVEIVLVDADFAKPDVMATLGLDDSIGLLEILADDMLDPESCIVRTDVPQLSLLPAGQRTHADTELLASTRTGEVIDRLLTANPKRIIVFDTPPTLAASPASVLATLVGQVMLVVRADRTTESDVREAVSLLDGCEHIQLVLNAVSYEPGGGRFGSYYGQEK